MWTRTGLWWALFLFAGVVVLGVAIANRWENWLYNMPSWVHYAHPALMVAAVAAALLSLSGWGLRLFTFTRLALLALVAWATIYVIAVGIPAAV